MWVFGSWKNIWTLFRTSSEIVKHRAYRRIHPNPHSIQSWISSCSLPGCVIGYNAQNPVKWLQVSWEQARSKGCSLHRGMVFHTDKSNHSHSYCFWNTCHEDNTQDSRLVMQKPWGTVLQWIRWRIWWSAWSSKKQDYSGSVIFRSVPYAFYTKDCHLLSLPAQWPKLTSRMVQHQE